MDRCLPSASPKTNEGNEHQQPFKPLSFNRGEGASSWRFPPLLASVNSSVALLKSPIVPQLPHKLQHRHALAPSGRKQRQPWSRQEDVALQNALKLQDRDDKPNWTQIAGKVNPTRTGKQCRERWQNHLRPDIKKGKWSLKEEQMIESMYQAFGPKWSSMAKLMANRTDNDIKNKWNSMRRARLSKAKKNDCVSYMQLPLRGATIHSAPRVEQKMAVKSASRDPPGGDIAWATTRTANEVLASTTTYATPRPDCNNTGLVGDKTLKLKSINETPKLKAKPGDENRVTFLNKGAPVQV